MQALSNLAKNTAINLSWKGAIERSVAEIVLNDKDDIQFNDARLNKIAMNTWNSQTCTEVFNVINKILNPIEYNWKPLLNSLLTLRTIIYYGSEKAIDMAIELCPTVYKLQNYNSALQKNSRGVPRGGQDYGAPIREEAKKLYNILQDDNEIRNARIKARAQNGDMLVPIGDKPIDNNQNKQNIQFGMGAGAVSQGVSGATFSLSNVPNLYEGRPERYFDSENDPRRRPGGDVIPDFSTWNVTDIKDMVGTGGGNNIDLISTGEGQEKKSITNDLLDLVFNSNDAATTNPNLPNADYLPALQKQKELEQQLALQQEQLRALQQQQQVYSNNNVNMGMDVMNIGMPVQSIGAGNVVTPSQNMGMGSMGMPSQSMMSPSLPQQQQPVSSILPPTSIGGMLSSFPIQQQQQQQQQQPILPLDSVFDGLSTMQQPSVVNNMNGMGTMPAISQAPISSDPFAAIRNLTNNGVNGMGMSVNDEVPSHAPPPPPSAPAPSL